MPQRSFGLVKVWIALLVLLALSAGSAWLRLGPWNSIANLGIAALKAALVALFFMRLARSGPLLRMVALTALSTLALLLVLSGVDYWTRNVFRAPWDQPPVAQTQSAAAGPAARTPPPARGLIVHSTI
jgi:cytochrome c oxidase subunit 4